MQWLTSAGGIAGSISAVLALLTAILFKPIRNIQKRRKQKAIDEAAFREEIRNAIAELKTELTHVKEDIKTDEKDSIRQRVFAFAGECRRDQNHTLDEYRFILSQNDKYQDLLRQTNDKNGVFASDFAYILKTYETKQEANDFLV